MGLGVRQRRLLADMATHGQGQWPHRWVVRPRHREVMASLHGKGMVTDPEPQRAALTETGRLCASYLVG